MPREQLMQDVKSIDSMFELMVRYQNWPKDYVTKDVINKDFKLHQLVYLNGAIDSALISDNSFVNASLLEFLQ